MEGHTRRPCVCIRWLATPVTTFSVSDHHPTCLARRLLRSQRRQRRVRQPACASSMLIKRTFHRSVLRTMRPQLEPKHLQRRLLMMQPWQVCLVFDGALSC